MPPPSRPSLLSWLPFYSYTQYPCPALRYITSNTQQCASSWLLIITTLLPAACYEKIKFYSTGMKEKSCIHVNSPCWNSIMLCNIHSTLALFLFFRFVFFFFSFYFILRLVRAAIDLVTWSSRKEFIFSHKHSRNLRDWLLWTTLDVYTYWINSRFLVYCIITKLRND
jgi:hypothetical protein